MKSSRNAPSVVRRRGGIRPTAASLSARSPPIVPTQRADSASSGSPASLADRTASTFSLTASACLTGTDPSRIAFRLPSGPTNRILRPPPASLLRLAICFPLVRAGRDGDPVALDPVVQVLDRVPHAPADPDHRDFAGLPQAPQRPGRDA